jgi:sugar lactone lactonase YvrE
MLVGMRPRMEIAAKVGRINVFTPDGKQKTEYLVGFINPTGWGIAPSGFGSYAGNLFIVDAGRPAAKNEAARDGTIYRLDNKGVVRPFASGLVDPNCLRITSNAMVIADPAEQGKPGKGAIVIVSSML